MMCNGLRGIGGLYELIEELLHLPSKQPLHPSQMKFVEAQLDESLEMLDLIGAVRDCMVAVREHVLDLRSALRVKGKTINVSTKKVHKLIKDCRRSLKQMANKPVTCFVANNESDLLLKALVEAREGTMSLLQSIMSFFSKPKQKATMWWIISKANSKRRIACVGESENMTEEEIADMWFQASYDCITFKDVDASQSVMAQNQLETLETRVESLDSGLYCLFRRLIQHRVSLLNLLSL